MRQKTLYAEASSVFLFPSPLSVALIKNLGSRFETSVRYFFMHYLCFSKRWFSIFIQIPAYLLRFVILRIFFFKVSIGHEIFLGVPIGGQMDYWVDDFRKKTSNSISIFLDSVFFKIYFVISLQLLKMVLLLQRGRWPNFRSSQIKASV